MRGRLMLVAAIMFALAGRGVAVCVGDCGNDGEVTVDEFAAEA